MLAKLIGDNAIHVVCSFSKYQESLPRVAIDPGRRSREIKYSNPPARCGADSCLCTPCVEVASLAFCDRASRLHNPGLPHLLLVLQASRFNVPPKTKQNPRFALADTHLFAPDNFPFRSLLPIYVSSYLPISLLGLHLYHNLTLDHWASRIIPRVLPH